MANNQGYQGILQRLDEVGARQEQQANRSDTGRTEIINLIHENQMAIQQNRELIKDLHANLIFSQNVIFNTLTEQGTHVRTMEVNMQTVTTSVEQLLQNNVNNNGQGQQQQQQAPNPNTYSEVGTCGKCIQHQFNVLVTHTAVNGKPRFLCALCNHDLAASSIRRHIRLVCYPKVCPTCT